jgi:hypothetical protein
MTADCQLIDCLRVIHQGNLPIRQDHYDYGVRLLTANCRL